MPHSGNTLGFKEKFETSAQEEESRAERRRERRRQRRLTEEEDGPSEGSTLTTKTKFEKGEVFDDHSHFFKTEVVDDEIASSGKVSVTTEKFITRTTRPVIILLCVALAKCDAIGGGCVQLSVTS